VGKHTAADDSTVDPLVADALARRGDAPPAAAHGEHSGGSTGWPEPAPGGGGEVGWPGETGPAPDDAPADAPQESAAGEADRDVAPLARPVPMTARRGWRRLFGASPAA